VSNAKRFVAVLGHTVIMLGWLLSPSLASASISVFFMSSSWSQSPTGSPLLNRREQPVRVLVTSSSAVQAVHVRVEMETLQQVLTYQSPHWIGTLSLGDLPRGTYTLTAVATNADGERASTSITLPYDLLPVVTITSPEPGTVAQPTLHVRAQCTDDDPVGCTQLSVLAAGTVVATGVNTIDADVDLSAYDGTERALTVEGVDSLMQVGSFSVEIAVEASPGLVELETIHGRVLDIDETRIVVMDRERRTTITLLDRRSGQYWVVAPNLPTTPDYALHPFWGVALATDTFLFTHYNPLEYSTPFSVLHAWRAGQLFLLSHPSSSHSLAAAGQYAIWSEGTKLVRRDLQGGADLTISTTAGNWKNAVSANGDVWFWGSDHQIHHFHEGTTTALTSDDFVNFYPLSDGEHVVYAKRTPPEVVSGPFYAIAMNGPEGEELLDSDDPEREPVPGTDYQIAGGYVAYTSLWGGARQVFLRRPNGVRERLTEFGSHSVIDALSGAGGVMLLNGVKRYFAAPGVSPIAVSGAPGKAVAIGTGFQLVLGRSVFALPTPGDGGPSEVPSSDAGAGSELDAGSTDLDATANADGAPEAPDATSVCTCSSDAETPEGYPGTDLDGGPDSSHHGSQSDHGDDDETALSDASNHHDSPGHGERGCGIGSPGWRARPRWDGFAITCFVTLLSPLRSRRVGRDRSA
jgi:hypothetical protein